MAIVPNLAFPPNTNPSFPVDPPLTTPNRYNAGSPAGTLTPLYAGEIVVDTTGHQMYQALGTSNNSWAQVVVDND